MDVVMLALMGTLLLATNLVLYVLFLNPFLVDILSSILRMLLKFILVAYQAVNVISIFSRKMSKSAVERMHPWWTPTDI